MISLNRCLYAAPYLSWDCYAAARRRSLVVGPSPRIRVSACRCLGARTSNTEWTGSTAPARTDRRLCTRGRTAQRRRLSERWGKGRVEQTDGSSIFSALMRSSMFWEYKHSQSVNFCENSPIKTKYFRKSRISRKALAWNYLTQI